MTFEAFFNDIETHYAKQLPFVVYQKPLENKLNVLLQQDNKLHTITTFNEKGFVFAPFNLNETSILLPFEKSKFVSIDIETLSSKKTSKIDDDIDDFQKKQHIHLINKAIDTIKDGVFKKVVVSRQESITIEQTNPIQLFKNLLKTYPTAFNYCWFHPKVGLWLGATPETLIKIEGKQFSIMALAGTQNDDGKTAVVWQDKEKEEQQMVTDFIVERLKPSVEHLNVSETETVKAGNLLHLKTMISVRLKADASLKNILDLIHPTPAVCGVPKELAKQFILENEHYNREFYTGFLGELNFETTHKLRSSKRNIENRAYNMPIKYTTLYVNLRCMQIKNKAAILYVGGGITANSHANSEWEETVSKSLIIKNIL